MIGETECVSIRTTPGSRRRIGLMVKRLRHWTHASLVRLQYLSFPARLLSSLNISVRAPPVYLGDTPHHVSRLVLSLYFALRYKFSCMSAEVALFQEYKVAAPPREE